MAEKQISILLVAKNLASGTLGKVTRDVSTLGKVSNRAGQGMRSLGANLAKLGAIAAVGIGVAVKGGLESLAELESAVSSVDGAIVQLGLTGKVTGAQVASWANEIEGATDAAFDDKAITAGAGALIRYGKVTQDNLRPAMQVMVDLAAKTGDVDSAASLLAKALADPAKAAGKLAKQGVILTKVEQDQIKALVKAGDSAGAQAVLLRALERTTKGAAEALNGPYKDALNESGDAVEDAQRALAEGFMPVIAKAATWIKTKLADPAVIQGLKDLGNSLAGMLDKGLDFATSIPWDKVKSAASAIGTGAKMALDAFLAMPAWVQTAVVGGWGLNKLTGGALGDIVGELGKGLIKGVLGINAGVVNINAATVNGGGGLPGGKGGGGVPGVPVAGVAAAGILGPGLGMAAAMAAAPIIAFQLIPKLWAELAGVKPEAGVNVESSRDPGFQANRQIAALLAGVPKIVDNTAQTVSVNRENSAGLNGVRAAALESARAIRAKKWDVDVNVNVPVRITTKVSVRDVTRVIVTSGRYNGKTVPV